VILPDVNVPVHAHNADSAVHDTARSWWDAALAGSEGVGLAWAAILGFVRITTNRKIVARPLPVADVMARVASWLELPHVHFAQPSDTHFARLRTALEDFARFAGLRWVNPCAAQK
jgi:predicted nucleic acid-binding protein